MQPSSLVFLVIIAIWAAYLLQHWVRRREHLATARSIDRFSDAMRVLERRTPLPESELSMPSPRSYAVSPARPSRSEVVVKRAQSPTVTDRPAPPVRSTRVFHALAGMSARRVRGLSLLAAFVLVVIVSALAAFSVLPGWSVLVAVAVLVVDLGWLRHAAVSERGARRAKSSGHDVSSSRPARGLASRVKVPARRSTVTYARAARQSASAVNPSAPAAAAPPASDQGADPEPALVAVASAVDEVPPVEPQVEARPEAAAEVMAQALVGEPAQADPSAWAPVPVPPPTYTLKARAERPRPVPIEVADDAMMVPSSFGGLVDEGELDGLLDRRRAAGA